MRWWIARWLGRRAGWCWAELVVWAVSGQRRFWDVLELRGSQGQCERRGEMPYCGKCQRPRVVVLEVGHWPEGVVVSVVVRVMVSPEEGETVVSEAPARVVCEAGGIEDVWRLLGYER